MAPRTITSNTLFYGEPLLPTETGTFKQARRVEQRLGEQPRLDL